MPDDARTALEAWKQSLADLFAKRDHQLREVEADNARLREALRQVRDDASALAAASDTGDAPDIVRGLRSLYTLADAALAGTLEDTDD